jgi:hypothetical protein
MKKLLIFSLLLLCTNAFAQKQNAPDMPFGKIKPEDFAPKSYPIDSSAHAVILFQAMSAEYEPDNVGGFNIIYKYHKRMRLLNKTSFDEATVEIPITTGGRFEDEVKKMEAATYNVEGGEVVVSKLDKGSIYKDKVVKGYYVKKFTFPALKEGSIIEYQYTIICPHETYLRGWTFQDEKYPTLWSQFDYTVPELYQFLPIRQGYDNFVINTELRGATTYHLANGSSTGSYNATTFHHTYALENVPALKDEGFTTTLDNYISRIDFYLLRVNYPGEPSRRIIKDWSETASLLLKDENFGSQISASNNWLKNELDFASGKSVDSIEKIKSIFGWVKSNFECTDNTAILLSQPLKKTLQSRKGSVADINLLLTAFLKRTGFNCKPVLLSTRKHGRPLETYPILNQFNYLISYVELGNQTFLLDASDKSNTFNKLPLKCYNGSGRVIDEEPVLISISSDSVSDSKVTSVFIINKPAKDGLSAAFTSTPGYYESLDLKEKIKKTTVEEYFKEIKKTYSFDVDIINTSIDSLKDPEEPIKIQYEFDFKTEDDIVYLNPMLTEATKKNPFVSAERFYPVEMSYKPSETYVFNMEIPEGYRVDELPKSARVKLNDNQGIFEYIIVNNGTNIQLRSKIALYKANFSPEDYETLRNFFDYIVKKHAEQIVFKKIK